MTNGAEWLEMVRVRLSLVEEERESVGSEIGRLEARARQLSEERLHLRALLDLPTDTDARAPVTPATTAGTTTQTAQLLLASVPNDSGASTLEPKVASSEVWRSAVRDILIKAQGPMHYTLLQSALRRTGVTFGGQNPAASFLAVLNRDNSFERVGRGTYWLKGQPHNEKSAVTKRRRRSRSKVRKVS